MQLFTETKSVDDYIVNRSDQFIFTGIGNDVIMEDHNDIYTMDNTYRGGRGNDLIISHSGDDLVFGGMGNDTVIVDQGYRDLELHGGRGYDILLIERNFGPGPLNAYQIKYDGFEEVHYI